MEENTQPVEAMEQQAPVSAPEESASSFSFVSDEEVAQINQPTPQVEEQPIEAVAPEAQTTQETTSEETPQETEAPSANQQEYSEGDLDSAVMSFLSERLGKDISSIDDLKNIQEVETKALDERIEAIAKFVEDTGRSPEDWFRYQSLNPEGMDDMTAIQIEMANSYPNLSYEELNLLVGSKYKLDADVHTDDEIKLSQLQLKIDAEKARGEINRIRDNYSSPEVPEPESAAPKSMIDDNWINQMSKEVDALTGLEFDLGNNNLLEFGLDDQYKSQLKSKNARLDEYFDGFVNQDGKWDYDKLSSHMAVVDNVDKIVKSAYTKGLGDGQKNLLNTAANVSTDTPRQNTTQNQDTILSDQLKQALDQQSGFGFI